MTTGDDFAFDVVSRPSLERAGKWTALVNAVVGTVESGQAVRVHPKPGNMRTFRTMIYTRLKAHNLRVRTQEQADAVVVWAEAKGAKDDA